MTHNEKLARAALAKWLELYEKQTRCDECIPPSWSRCDKHQPDIAKLIKNTKMLLAGGPN